MTRDFGKVVRVVFNRQVGMNLDRMPVLIGVGQVTKKDEPLESCSSPVDLIIESARKASEDTGIGEAILKQLDELVLVRCFQETFRNSPQLVADRIGASQARCYLTPYGGNIPQYLMNRYSEAIVRGEIDLVMFAGSEALDNQIRLAKAGIKPNWEAKQDSDFEYLFPNKPLCSKMEHVHQLSVPSNIYPMFENALRHHYDRSIEDHQTKLGELFSGFTQVAAKTPTSWYPIARSAEAIAKATPKNRYVGWPYTKFMNAMNNINQGAALILSSAGRAKALGVPEHRWVYLHGVADAHDTVNLTERVNYYSSPAIKKIGEVAFEQAGFSMDEVAFLDIYSCFPVAVEVACDMLGIAIDDPRGLTVTGGLPYHGGAGNNYVMNSIATMADILRENPGKKGMITANGGYLTKHSIGLYSTEPPAAASSELVWKRRNPTEYQAELDAMPHPESESQPKGKGKIEAYTVLFNRDNEPVHGLVIGRLEDDLRFCARTPEGADVSAWIREDMVATTGLVHHDADTGVNYFSEA